MSSATLKRILDEVKRLTPEERRQLPSLLRERMSTHSRVFTPAGSPAVAGKGVPMQVLYRCCCGLDVHAKTVVACLIKGGKKQTRTFSTMTDDLLALADWLAAAGCPHVAIESTGVYWKPVWHLLEGRLELMLVNAQHIKRVPGRKTDCKDAEWIAQLLEHGLLKSSFVPDRPQRELRDLTRQRARSCSATAPASSTACTRRWRTPT